MRLPVRSGSVEGEMPVQAGKKGYVFVSKVVLFVISFHKDKMRNHIYRSRSFKKSPLRINEKGNTRVIGIEFFCPGE